MGNHHMAGAILMYGKTFLSSENFGYYVLNTLVMMAVVMTFTFLSDRSFCKKRNDLATCCDRDGITPLAARRCVTPTHKLKLILTDQLTSFALGYVDVSGAVMCVVLVMASFFMVRRERYDSI